RTSTVAKQLFKDSTRVVLHRQWLRFAAPRDRVGVGATQIASAGAGIGRTVHRKFERSDLGVFSEVPGEQLIDRDLREYFQLVCASACGARQKRSRCARMDVNPACVEAREHEQLI